MPHSLLLGFRETITAATTSTQRNRRSGKLKVERSDRCKSSLYAKLPSTSHTRLVKLSVQPVTEKINCSLVVGLPEVFEGTYIAISYVWGEDGDRASMICNGKNVRITQNLHDALSSVRPVEGDRFVWCDALCINQQDCIEKTHHLPLMGSLYARAAEVFVWLGGNIPLPSNSFENLKDVFAIICGRDISAERCQFPGRDSLERLIQDCSPEELSRFGASEWYALFSVFQQAWFRRIWVIQEVSANPRIVVGCGGERVEWMKVALVAKWLEYHDHVIVKQLPADFTFRGIYNAAFMYDNTVYRSQAWLRLLDRGRSFQASDPRDKVYALIGQPSVEFGVEDGTRQLLLEYSTATSTAEIYSDVVMRHIKQSNRLDILSQVDHGERLLESEYPTWVPRWDRPSRQNIFVPDDSLHVQACGEQEAAVLQPGTNMRLLSLTGALIDRVHETSASSHLDTLATACKDPLMNPLLSFWYDHVDARVLPEDSNSVDTALALTVTAGGTAKPLYSPDTRMMADFSAV